MSDGADNEAQIRRQIEAWAAAVRRRDMAAILRDHADDFVMFDVPPPLSCTGLEAYRATWPLFFELRPRLRCSTFANSTSLQAPTSLSRSPDALRRHRQWAGQRPGFPPDHRPAQDRGQMALHARTPFDPGCELGCFRLASDCGNIPALCSCTMPDAKPLTLLLEMLWCGGAMSEGYRARTASCPGVLPTKRCNDRVMCA